MLPTKFRFICLSSFKGEYFIEIDQSETRIACGGHVIHWVFPKFDDHLTAESGTFWHLLLHNDVARGCIFVIENSNKCKAVICSAPFIYFSIVEKETHVLDNGSKPVPKFSE
jgi:hypothetical protein